MRIEAAEPEHVDQLSALCLREGGESWADRDRARRALTAPGAGSVVALDDGAVVGAAHAVSDGEITSYLGMLLVDPAYRGRGLGRALLDELFTRGRFRRLDLLAVEESAGFYARLNHRKFPGFRIYAELR